ncbi:GH85 family endohexosaminidase C-terminal domain-containing protein, partial [Streptomyces alkaliterrae]|nr:endo-beta-N-acetylglucosaminidase [Streptomyces alkaliterrae]
GGPGPWQPPARHVADRSAVTALPFGTTFNTGHGTAWYEAGRRASDTEWNHLGLQDPLPARRWAIHGNGPRPTVTLDFAAAWHGGSSLLLDGAEGFDGVLELFRCRLPAGPDTRLTLVHRAEPGSGPVRVAAAWATAEPAEPGAAPAFRHHPAATVRGPDGWTTSVLRPRLAAGSMLRALAVGLRGVAGRPVRWRLGALTVTDGRPSAPGAPTDARITAAARLGADEAEARLRWRAPRGGPCAVHHHELHQVLPDGRRRFLGGTAGEAYYLGSLRRAAGERTTRVEIRAVSHALVRSPAVAVAHRW